MEKKYRYRKLIITAVAAATGMTMVFSTPFVSYAKDKSEAKTETKNESKSEVNKYGYINSDLKCLLQPNVKAPDCVNVKKVLITETATPYSMLYLYNFNSGNKYDSYSSIMDIYDYVQGIESGTGASPALVKTIAETNSKKSSSKTKKRKIVLKERADNSTSELDSNGLIPIKVGNTVFVDYGKLKPMGAYMGYHLITAVSSQLTWKESHDWSYDSEGFATYNGRYIIACTETYGTVGDYVDFYLENGLIIPCIIGDIKDNRDSTWTVYGHKIGNYLNVIEFCVSPTWYAGLGHENPGTSTCHPEFGYKVLYAVCGGKVDTSINYNKKEETETTVVTEISGSSEGETTYDDTVIYPTEANVTTEQTTKETNTTTTGETTVTETQATESEAQTTVTEATESQVTEDISEDTSK